MADIVKRNLKKVALLVDTTGYGDGGLKDLEAALQAAGLKPHIVVRFKVGVKTLTDEMKQLKDSGADALIGWTVGPEQGVISASRAAAGWNVPQYGPWGLSHASAFEASKGAVEGDLRGPDRVAQHLHGTQQHVPARLRQDIQGAPHRLHDVCPHRPTTRCTCCCARCSSPRATSPARA